MHPTSNNIGAYITSRLALENATYGAGAGLPATDAVAIERTAKRPLHQSGKLQVGYKATLASGHTASFVYGLTHADQDSSYVNVTGASGVTSLTGLNSGAAVYGVAELDVNLVGVKSFMKARFGPPVMSHSGTDVIEICAMWVLGGGETIPPTETAQ